MDFVQKEIIAKLKAKVGSAGPGGSDRQKPAPQSGFVPLQPPSSRPIPFMPDPMAGPPLREFVPPRLVSLLLYNLYYVSILVYRAHIFCCSGNRNPFALGSRDLDPFGGMGGNIMGPGNFP